MGRKKEGTTFGTVVASIKEERLRKHLDKEVPKLVRSWIGELQPQHPLYYPGGWSESPYSPPKEQDADTNHILRRHIRKRALWSHHATWEQQLDKAYQTAKEVKRRSEEVFDEHRKGIKDSREYTENYLGIALWRGFDYAAGDKPQKWYKASDGSKGVDYGAHQIEESASPEQVGEVEKEHWRLTCDLARLPEMKSLVKEWQRVRETGEKIQELADRALREHDIFYPCKFCRRLWD